MKVNFTLWGTIRTGGNRVIFEVAKRLANRGHEISVTSLGARHHYWFPLKAHVTYPESKLSISIPRKGKRPIVSLINYALQKAKSHYEIDRVKLLAQHIPSDIDINVATFCLTSFAVWRSNKGVPFYYIQHYEPFFFSDVYSRKKAEETYYLPLKWLVNSSWVNNLLKDKFGKMGTLVTPGVDLNTFHPRVINKSDNAKNIMCLGKSAPIKGLCYLFQALKIVYKKYSKIRLILYGSEPNLKSSSPIPCEYVYKPSDEELARLYSSAELVVVPSLYESSPLPPLEAMACGAPVVTTPYGTEDYCIDGKNSLVVPPKDPRNMARAIMTIITNEKLSESLRNNGLDTAKQFTWDKTVDKIAKTFRESLKEAN